MEDKLKWVKNYERLQDIQGQLVWPSISEIDPRALIPDVSIAISLREYIEVLENRHTNCA